MSNAAVLLPSKQNTKQHDLFAYNKHSRHPLLLQNEEACNTIHIIHF